MIRGSMNSGTLLLRRSLHELPKQPWKNGAGLTRELAVAEGWRISVADVSSNGPFSLFQDHCRHSVILQGAGLDLSCGPDTVVLDPQRCASYDGGMPWQARLRSGPVLVLNVMAQRHKVLAHVAVGATQAHGQNPGIFFGICLGGNWTCTQQDQEPWLLRSGEFIIFESGDKGFHCAVNNPSDTLVLTHIRVARC